MAGTGACAVAGAGLGTRAQCTGAPEVQVHWQGLEQVQAQARVQAQAQ